MGYYCTIYEFIFVLQLDNNMTSFKETLILQIALDPKSSLYYTRIFYVSLFTSYYTI